MTVDIGEVESFLGIPTPKLNVHSMTPILLPEGIKDRFKSLKMDFLERGHEAEFYNLISSFVPQFKSLLDLKDMEKQVMTQKSNLKSQKESISDIKLQCEAIISEICLNLNEIETNKKQMINTIGNIRDLESELNYINTFHYADQIEMELNQLQNEIDDDNSRIEELMMEEEKLVVVSTNAELDAMKALKISEERDPQIEELARWYISHINQ
ncbi:hypothetical protein HDV02_003503 [Globomyces sp. JEL0801]|nr:hypothetical protein HDV02_003503 [Globomyces sp. JEL0801]